MSGKRVTRKRVSLLTAIAKNAIRKVNFGLMTQNLFMDTSKKVSVLLLLIALLLIASPVQANEDRSCLARAMYFEARDQGWRGMLAVGVVVKNRMMHPRWPSTACGVVRQGRYWKGNPVRHMCQFSYWCDGKHERPTEPGPWSTALDLANQILVADLTIEGLEEATHYHALSVTPQWSRTLDHCGTIGEHKFYD